jgi:hypothetical protein
MKSAFSVHPGLPQTTQQQTARTKTHNIHYNPTLNSTPRRRCRGRIGAAVGGEQQPRDERVGKPE